MFNVSSRFKRIIDQPGRKFWYKVKLGLKSGEKMELENCDIMAGGFSVDRSTSTVGQFILGDVTASEFNLQLNNFMGKFNFTDFEGATLLPYVGLIVEEHYEDGPIPEWVKMGTFKAQAADTRGSVVNIKAYDAMMDFAIPYVQSELKYPATLLQILENCCQDCGVPLLTRDFLNAGYVVPERPEDGALTYRDVVHAVAELAGCFTRLTPDGALELAWYDMEHPATEFQGVTDFWAQDLTITGVKMGPYREGEPAYIRGEEEYTLDIYNNPLAQTDRDVVCRAVGDKITGFTFRPYTYMGQSNPALEAGDTVVFYDRRGNGYKSAITYTVYREGGTQKYTAEAQTPAMKNFTFFSLTDKVQEAAKNDAKRQISAYDTMAKQFSSMTANSMGFYQTTEKQDDGSEIWYQHDKPVLEESKIIWKKSLDTMAVSTDGGKTWQGMDKNGNAVLNVLAAHGIVADWIKTGRIEAQTGGAYLDLDKGEAAMTKMISNRYPQYVANIGPSEQGDYGAWNLYDGKDCMISIYKVFVDGKDGGVVITSPYLTDGEGENHKGIKIDGTGIGLFADNDGKGLGFFSKTGTGNGKNLNIVEGDLYVHGRLGVDGTEKNRIVHTSAGRIGVSAYETAEPYFGDIGDGKTNGNGSVKVNIDPLFSETVNTKEYPYQVFLQPYANGTFWVSERAADHFVVNGPANSNFGWEIKARQKGCENDRLKLF